VSGDGIDYDLRRLCIQVQQASCSTLTAACARSAIIRPRASISSLATNGLPADFAPIEVRLSDSREASHQDSLPYT
jgi:hypothetical protein